MSEHLTASPELSERVHDWYATITRERATQIIEFGRGQWGLLTPEWPQSQANNGILVREDPGADRLISIAEELLGDSGFRHRYIMAMCDLSSGTRYELAAAGYSLEPELQMVRPLTDADIRPADPRLHIVDEATIRPFNARLWREEWLPSASEETIAQLVGRRETYSRSTELISLVITESPTSSGVDPESFVATCDLAVRDWAAEIDGVATLAAHRKKGYGEILMDAALSTARSHGCDCTVLTALADDWPQHWYARRGFLNTGPAWVATRLLDQPVVPSVNC
jgi:ribosomal protein S18 acetylase RimI-like enzyme